jgi:putative ABC transport system permease protein
VSRVQLFLRMLFKAAWVRKDRALTALVSAAVVATIATAALTVYSDLESDLSRTFRGFGANVVISKAQGSLTPDEIAKIKSTLVNKGMVVPVAYAIAGAFDGSKVVVGGANTTDLLKLNSWWSISGSISPAPELVGARVAERANGKPFMLAFGGKTTVVQASAVIHSGAEDDSRVYLDLPAFVALTGVEPNTALVRVDGRPQEIHDTIARLSSSLPNLEVKPVRRFTQTQTEVVGKTRSVVLASSAVVVVLIMLCMAATFTSAVLERRKDFAVMKALGASNRLVGVLFAAEASLLALTGAAAGFAAGSAIAYWIGKANFDAAILPQPTLVFPVLLGSMALALLASTAPLRLLQQIQPAGILRGE